MPKATPGPWETVLMADREGDWYAIEAQLTWDGRTGTVADTLNRDDLIGPDENRANARLIAAGPRMYEFILECASKGNEEARAILEEINASSD